MLDRTIQQAAPLQRTHHAFSTFAEPAAGNAHPVDLRVTVPVPGRPMFVSVLAGPERRSKTRCSLECARHPLRTIGNIVFLGSSLIRIYVLGMVAFLATGSVLQF
jgi:hypothetical protein